MNFDVSPNIMYIQSVLLHPLLYWEMYMFNKSIPGDCCVFYCRQTVLIPCLSRLGCLGINITRARGFYHLEMNGCLTLTLSQTFFDIFINIINYPSVDDDKDNDDIKCTYNINIAVILCGEDNRLCICYDNGNIYTMPL